MLKRNDRTIVVEVKKSEIPIDLKRVAEAIANQIKKDGAVERTKL